MIDYKRVAIFLATTSCLLFSGCATSASIVEKKDNAMISVDEKQYLVKNSYQDTKHLVTKTYSTLSHFFSDVKVGIYENELVKFIASDDTILENRKDLVIWKKDSKKMAINIIKKYLKKNKKDLDYDGLSLASKIEILNNYFFELKQKEHLSKFEQKHKKPTFDEFKSDRKNVEAINRYKYELNKSKHEWELNLEKTKKEVATDILSSLYGKPIVKFISYDPNNKKAYMLVTSSRESFSQKISVDLEPELAKKLKNNFRYVKSKLYFNFEETGIVLIGASVNYMKKEYLANFEDKLYKRDNKLKLTTSELKLDTLDIDYKIVAADVEPPKWFYTIPEDGTIIGYGMGDTEQEAKNTALKEIAQRLEVVVTSDTSTNKKRDGDQISSKTSHNVNIKTKDKNLKGAKTIKSQKKDGVWFLAVSY